MKIYEGRNTSDELVYFEVPNTFLPRRSAIKLIKNIPGVEVINEEINKDVFCTFKLGDRSFQIMEPFSDNSRYHIGEAIVTKSNELEIIKQRFIVFKPCLLTLFIR